MAVACLRAFLEISGSHRDLLCLPVEIDNVSFSEQ